MNEWKITAFQFCELVPGFDLYVVMSAYWTLDVTEPLLTIVKKFMHLVPMEVIEWLSNQEPRQAYLSDKSNQTSFRIFMMSFNIKIYSEPTVCASLVWLYTDCKTERSHSAACMHVAIHQTLASVSEIYVNQIVQQITVQFVSSRKITWTWVKVDIFQDESWRTPMTNYHFNTALIAFPHCGFCATFELQINTINCFFVMPTLASCPHE